MMPGMKLSVSEIEECVPNHEKIREEFFQIMMESYGWTEEEINNFLLNCKDIHQFMNLYIKLYKVKDLYKGTRYDKSQEIMIFSLVDELNRAYGDCVCDAGIQTTGDFRTYRNYKREKEEEKIIRANTIILDLWGIKNLYAKAFGKAIPEKNGKVLKKELTKALNELKKEKVIYDFMATDIYVNRDKHGRRIVFNRVAGQENSFFRPDRRVHMKKGPKYK